MRQRAVAATLWSGVDNAFRAGIGFAVAVVLARLVSPADFGLLAMVMIFAVVASALVDSGLGLALIQRQDAGPEEEAAVFCFNVAIGIGVALALALASTSIASFLGEPRLTAIIPLLALNVVVGALGSIHATLLTKAMDVRPLAFIGVCSTLISGALAIVLAWLGFGAQALAWQLLAQSAISTVLMWVLHPWRPTRRFSLTVLSRLAAFGTHVLLANLVDAAYRRLHGIVIGKSFGAADAGWYARAQSTQEMPAGFLAGMLNRVALPVFSQAATEPARLSEAFRRALRLLMFLNLPVMAGMAVVADPLVEAVFGRAWLPAAPVLQVLCVAGALWPVHVLNVSALAARGRTSLLLKLELAKKSLGLAGLVIALPFGLLAIAGAQAVTSVVAFFINTRDNARIAGMGAVDQLKTIAPSIASTGIMVLAVLLVGIVPIEQAWQRLALLVPVGALVYAAASRWLDPSPWQELALYLRSRRRA